MINQNGFVFDSESRFPRTYTCDTNPKTACLAPACLPVNDNRHTLITDLAESGPGDETVKDIAGHIRHWMLKHYSHSRLEAKCKALESIVSNLKLEALFRSRQISNEIPKIPRVDSLNYLF